MAANNFEALTRALASSTSRRQTLKALVAGTGGLLGLGSLGTALAGEADPKPYCGKTGDSCAKFRCCKGYACNLKTHICYKP
ncbi:MAG TPA: hypothetical protein VFV38_05225 [Ktedonobacteraceae bacterium]|nr:hypothetical protein [Ktedonobacteraceae bacterium]